MNLALITTMQIYDLLRTTPMVIPKAQETYTYIDFSKMYKPFNKLAMNAFDLDLEYNIIHRDINVTPKKIKRLHILNNDHCNLCNQYAETLNIFLFNVIKYEKPSHTLNKFYCRAMEHVC